MAGPRKGAVTKHANGISRSAGDHMSERVAAPIESPGLPASPARNRHIVKAAMLFENPAPRVNSAKSGIPAK